jgi:general secretion pathway protein I
VKRAFSLLEMMVAIALLSMGLVLLLQVQARSIQLAQDAREMTVATMLARGKLLDCQTDLLKKGFSVGDYDEEGNFDDEGYSTFFWECHGYKPDMPVADAGDVTEAFGGAGAGDTAAAAQDQGADLGMQFLAPVLSQMSNILGDSIRELVVIVRWGEGNDIKEMSVTTHVIDKTAVNTIAAMIGQQSEALRGLTGGGSGAPGGKEAGGEPGSRPGAGPPGAPPGLPSRPGGMLR